MASDARAAASAGEGLFWEARHGRADGVTRLVGEGACVDWGHPVDGRTPLCAAACFDHLAAVIALLEAGAGVDVRERESGQTPLVLAVIENATRCVDRLIAAGADVNALDLDGLSPLMHAVIAGSKTVAASLLKAGARIEPGPTGVSAVELATVLGNAAVAKLIEEEAAARKAAAEKAATETAAAERVAAEAAAAEMRAAEAKAAAEKAAEQRAAQLAAAAERAAADSAAAAERAAAAAASMAASTAEKRPADGEHQQQPPLKVARTRMAAPEPGQFASSRLEVDQERGTGDVVVKLHATEIVRLRPLGELTLGSGGWRTVSTLEALNTSLAELVPKVGVVHGLVIASDGLHAHPVGRAVECRSLPRDCLLIASDGRHAHPVGRAGAPRGLCKR